MELHKLIFTIVFSCGIVFGLVFLWYLKFYKKYSDKTSQHLLWFLATFTLNNIQILWVDVFVGAHNCYVKNLHPFFFFVFVVPYFHAFIVGYLKIDHLVFRFIGVARVIFVIGMLARIVLLPYFRSSNCTLIGQYVQGEEIVIAALSLYIFIDVTRIVLFKKSLFTELLTYDKLQWVHRFLILGAIVLGFWFLAIVLNFKNYVNPQFYIYYPLRLSSSVLLYWVGYTGSFNKVLTFERTTIRQNAKSKAVYAEIQTKTTTTSDELKTILDYLTQNAPHLNPDFTASQLATALQITPNKISSILSENDIDNFSNFINKMRVEKAKLLLKDASYDDYTIDAISLESGFHSKSAFYRAFKKVTKTTPADFRRN